MKINIAGITKESVVDGPGIRYVIFSQGCKHNCRGCHNPSTHSFKKEKEIEVDKIIEDVLNSKQIDGVTLSGGDPFYQPKEFEYVARVLGENNVHIIAYSGFTYEKLLENKETRGLLEKVDVLIDGPFIENKKTLKKSYRGSENQRVIDVKKSINENKVITLEW